MEKRVTPPKRVTSPTWGPPPPCKQALCHIIFSRRQSICEVDLRTMMLIKEHVTIVTNKQVWTRIKHIPSNKKTTTVKLQELLKGSNSDNNTGDTA